MRVVLQRVQSAEVRVAGRVTGRIGTGCVLLVGFNRTDDGATLSWMADKVISLRVFGTSAGDAPGSSFSRTLAEIEGDLLVVSQFTLYGDVRKGRRPSFTEAAPPELAVPLYEEFIALLRARSAGAVETGEFGAMMEVELINDGPVTLLLER